MVASCAAVFGRIRPTIDVISWGGRVSEDLLPEGFDLVKVLAAGHLDGVTHHDLGSSIAVIIEVVLDRSVDA